MEFLHPKSEDGDKVVLLLLVSKREDTYAICYEWDADESLRQKSPRIVRRQLPSEHKLPCMVVPLIKSMSFLVVSRTSMAVYDMHSHGNQPSRYPIPVEDCEPQRMPLWTQWARPARDLLYKQSHDDIYLCREDGRVFLLAIGTSGEIEHETYLGNLDCDVDTAFDILDLGHEGGDLIVAAGNMGDGGLFIQNARDSPRCLQRFFNWGPITDSVTVEPTSRSQSVTETDANRLFACSASTVGRGSLVEFRHGIEAQVGLLIAQDELSSTREMWAMADCVNGGVYILTSDPMSSSLIYLPHDFGDEICALGEEESGLDFGTQTLAAGCNQLSILIQVTEKDIRLGTDHEPLARHCFTYGVEENVLCATVNNPGSLVVTAVRSHSEISLHLKAVVLSDNQAYLSDVGGPVIVDYEPVCLSIEHFDFASFVFVGTSDGKISIYRIGKNALLFSSIHSVDMTNRVDASKAVESIARVSTITHGLFKRSTLFCGLRGGTLVPFEIIPRSDNSTIGMPRIACFLEKSC